MRRNRQPSLRGSVTQNTGTVRVRAEDTSRLGLLIRVAIGISVLIVITLLGLWGWRTGWIHRQVTRMAEEGLHLTQKAHFAVGDIDVEGRQHANKDQLLLALDVTTGSPIFAFDPSQAETRIAKLPWVRSVIVERRLPDTIYVRLTEQEPLARWQHDNHVVVIDMQGKTLPDASPDQFPQLPLVVGEGAPAEANNLFTALHTFPTVDEKVAAAVRVGDRRWDLHLQPKIVVRLPESDIPDALKRLSILISEQKILERDIVTIDLRQPDRLVIEPSTAPSSQHPTDNRL